MAERRGARPTPPATTTTSPPAPSSTAHCVPNGPRTPITSPGSIEDRACVTTPTSRMVWTSAPDAAGSPLMEMGTSPTPNAYSMSNWPGENANPPPGGSRVTVTVSAVSRATWRTRAGAGAIGSARPRSVSVRMSVHVQQLHAGGLEPFQNHVGGLPHELVAELVVLLALSPQAGAVQGQRGHGLQDPGVEPPPVRREQPGEPDHLARADGLDHDAAALRCRDLDGGPTPPDQVEAVGRVSLPEQERAGVEPDVDHAPQQERVVPPVDPAEELVLGEEPLNGLHVRPPSRWPGSPRPPR